MRPPRSARRPAAALVALVCVLLIGVVLLAGYAYRRPLLEAAKLRNALGQNSGAYLRAEIPCPRQTKKTLVAVVLGQSNAGSYARGESEALANVVNFFEGRCFRAQEPLLGTDGRGTSPWIEFGNRLAASHDYVIVAPFTAGGTSIERWSGELGAPLRGALKALASRYAATHVLWHQGESDLGMGADEYAARLRKVIELARAELPRAAFYVALASRCGNSPRENGVRSGQRAVVDPGAGVFQGPDTDVIDERHDRCHFSSAGRLEAAGLWVSALRAYAAVEGFSSNRSSRSGTPSRR